MRLGVAAAPKCTHPLIPSVRNQKLLPTCISACPRVGDPSVDPVYVQIHWADNAGWTRSLVVKKSVGIPKKNTQVSLTVSAEYFGILFFSYSSTFLSYFFSSFHLFFWSFSYRFFTFFLFLTLLSFNFLNLPLPLFLTSYRSSSCSSLGQYYKRRIPQLALSVGKKDDDKWQNLDDEEQKTTKLEFTETGQASTS